MSDMTPNPETRIALFQRKEIRRTIHNDEWWFVIADVIAALTDSVDPQGYLKDMRRRDPELTKGWGQIATPLPIATASSRRTHPRRPRPGGRLLPAKRPARQTPQPCPQQPPTQNHPAAPGPASG